MEELDLSLESETGYVSFLNLILGDCDSFKMASQPIPPHP